MSNFPVFLKSAGGVDFSVPGLTRRKPETPQAAPRASVTPAVDVLDDAPVSAPVDIAPVFEEPAPVPPIYAGGVRLINAVTSIKGGMWADFLLRDVGPREVNPFKGLRWGKDNGQRMKTWIGPYSEAIELAELSDVPHLYAGETMLTYWGDTCSADTTVKVLFDPGPDGAKGAHPLGKESSELDLSGGKKVGSDLFVAFWAINDDESIIPKKAAKLTTGLHRMNEVKQANTVTNDPEFCNFLHARLDRFLGAQRPAMRLEDGPKKWAAEVVRLYLGGSRSVMNEENMDGVEARKRWKSLFSEYMQSDEYHERQMVRTGRY